MKSHGGLSRWHAGSHQKWRYCRSELWNFNRTLEQMEPWNPLEPLFRRSSFWSWRIFFQRECDPVKCPQHLTIVGDQHDVEAPGERDEFAIVGGTPRVMRQSENLFGIHGQLAATKLAPRSVGESDGIAQRKLLLPYAGGEHIVEL